MRILGIDPGLAVTGYAVIEAQNPERIKLIEAGIIRTKPRESISDRLKKIYSNLEELVDDNAPQVLVLEKLYSHYKHPTTSILMAHARGAICLLCGLKKIKLISYPSTRIKKAVTGKGHASKIQVQSMVAELMNLKKIPEYYDVTDALALALSFVYIELRK